MNTASSTTSYPSLQISSSLRRPRRNSLRRTTTPKKSPPSPDPQRLNFVIDIENIKTTASNSLNKFISTTETKFTRYINSANEAFNDFKTSVSIDENRRLIISCRPQSLWFLTNSLIWGLLIIFVVRGIMGKFGFLLNYHGGYGNDVFFMKRDRSLGGREVVVGKREGKKKEGFDNSRVYSNPLSHSKEMMRLENDLELVRSKRVLSEDELPKWWPDLVVSSSYLNNNQEFKNEANRVIRAIMENRMCGRDITEDDILQFRRICKTSGAKVHIETTNARDSFYRESVNFVLNSCSSSGSSSSHVHIDGEDAREFVAGLADSIGLQNRRAARIVSAAVAARTRSCFLQAWAFEMQGKHAEALVELSKICLLHSIFPPNESSPEMEMVAQGLEKHLKVEQRELLLSLLAQVCSPPSTSAVEALGFTAKPSYIDDDRRRPTIS